MGFPLCVPVMGIPGGRGGCKLPSLWVTWLSLGLCPARKGRTSWDTQKKQRRQSAEFLVCSISDKEVPGLQVVQFWLVPLQAGCFLV